MPEIVFASSIQRHVTCPAQAEIHGSTVREVLEASFAAEPALRSYVVDDQGHLRQHVAIFVDGTQVQSRERLDDPVKPSGVVHVIQALSGG